MGRRNLTHDTKLLGVNGDSGNSIFPVYLTTSRITLELEAWNKLQFPKRYSTKSALPLSFGVIKQQYRLYYMKSSTAQSKYDTTAVWLQDLLSRSKKIRLQ